MVFYTANEPSDNWQLSNFDLKHIVHAWVWILSVALLANMDAIRDFLLQFTNETTVTVIVWILWVALKEIVAKGRKE